jgi:tRNA(adenine34) deaminase
MRRGVAKEDGPSVDKHFMCSALREARRGAREGEVPVGAVVVREGRVLARAHNRPIHLLDPSAHAEILALRRAARKLGNYRLEGCDLYVTIEPCAMCAGAIVQARLRRTVFGARDPKAGASGSALRVLNHPRLNHHVKVTSGILAGDCALVIQEFFRKKRKKASVVNRQFSVPER